MSAGTYETRAAAPGGRTPEDLAHAKAMLSPFVKAGYAMFPLARGAKHARDRGWQLRTYTSAELIDWLRRGGNLGFRLGPTHLVLDADPRHFEPGDAPLARLSADVGIDLASIPTVTSGRGDGGQHLYLRKPASATVRKSLPGYPGIDIKTAGGLVVAPGSRHIETGGIYEVDPMTAPIGEAPVAPGTLLEMLRRPPMAARVFGGGELSVEQLEELLSVLDPRNFRDYAKWVAFAAACHDATGGEGLDVWLDWAAQDPDYGSEEHSQQNGRTWDSFVAGKAGGATYLFILREVARAGHANLAHAIEPNMDFGDGPVLDGSELMDAPVLSSDEYMPDDAPIHGSDEEQLW